MLKRCPVQRGLIFEAAYVMHHRDLIKPAREGEMECIPV